MSVAPLNLRQDCVSLIEREARAARADRPAFIVAKINSLLDTRIIQALYRASQAGVEIELIVRGACSLRPGVRGVSSRIRVRSIVGRFLEHSRIFVFGNGGRPEVYLGSADWMPRNLYERVEVMFRLKDRTLCRRVCEQIVVPYLADTEKTRFLRADGDYTRARGNDGRGTARNQFNAQNFLIHMAANRNENGDFPPRPQHQKRHSSRIADLLVSVWEPRAPDASPHPTPVEKAD